MTNDVQQRVDFDVSAMRTTIETEFGFTLAQGRACLAEIERLRARVAELEAEAEVHANDAHWGRGW